MKLNSSFILHDDGNEKLLVSTGASAFSGLVRTNGTAGFLIGCLENDMTEDELVRKICAKYDISDEIARHDVRKVIDQLKGIGAIDE